MNVKFVWWLLRGLRFQPAKLIIYDPLVFVTINIFSQMEMELTIFSWNFKSDAVSEFSCSIVNRWGVVVHEMDNITDGWDKIIKMERLAKMVFIFIPTLERLTMSNFRGQGTIQLVRKNNGFNHQNR